MITYGKLFQYLVEHDISTKELSEKTGVSLTVLSRMRLAQNVSMAHVEKICTALNLQPNDIMEYLEKN